MVVNYLCSLVVTVFFFLLKLTDSTFVFLQELSESLQVREPDLLGELHEAADQLKSLSSEEIRNEINRAVEDTVVSWNDSRKSLRGLCERYQNAVSIWSTYRKNSDIVNEWVDNQLNSLSNLPAEETLHQLQVNGRDRGHSD